MGYGGSNWAYSGTFVQTFVATASGFPTQLNVYMGNNQNLFRWVIIASAVCSCKEGFFDDCHVPVLNLDIISFESVSLEIRVRGSVAFVGRFNNLKQSYADWTVTMNLGVVGVWVNAGDTVTFTLSNPSTSVGFNAITGAIAEYNFGTVQGYGNAIARFYFGEFH
jgi:hypothetical protein